MDPCSIYTGISAISKSNKDPAENIWGQTIRRLSVKCILSHQREESRAFPPSILPQCHEILDYTAMGILLLVILCQKQITRSISGHFFWNDDDWMRGERLAYVACDMDGTSKSTFEDSFRSCRKHHSKKRVE